MPTRARYMATDQNCMDIDGSKTYWDTVPIDTCHFDQYDILYEGLATKLSLEFNQAFPTVYTVTITFTLIKTETNLCGYKLFQTKNPKLLILKTQKGRIFKTRTRISINNLDIFAYINFKFIYVENHIKNQLILYQVYTKT